MVWGAPGDDGAGALVRAHADEVVSRGLGGPPRPYTLEHGRGWVAGRAADRLLEAGFGEDEQLRDKHGYGLTATIAAARRAVAAG